MNTRDDVGIVKSGRCTQCSASKDPGRDALIQKASGGELTNPAATYREGVLAAAMAKYQNIAVSGQVFGSPERTGQGQGWSMA